MNKESNEDDFGMAFKTDAHSVFHLIVENLSNEVEREKENENLIKINNNINLYNKNILNYNGKLNEIIYFKKSI